MSVTISKARNQTELARCLNLRREVFVLERGVPAGVERDQFDTLDGPCDHFVICGEGLDVGAFRCRREGECVRLQRFCLTREERGRGLGKKAVQRMEEFYRAQGVRRVELDAKSEAAGFYEKCGYRAVSQPFEEAGIPHVRMEKTL